MSVAEFGDVSKSFGRRVDQIGPPAIEHFNLTLEEQEFYCLLGPSGCGKTTALSLLAGFENPTSGKVLHKGTVVAGPGADRAVVFQGDDSLMPWLTASENILLGPRIQGKSKTEQDELADRLLTLVGLSGHGQKRPRELSGGMKQRIQIARVLANDPSMMLMDEPFAALDAQTRVQMQDELIRIWTATKRTVLFITHDVLESLILADRIGVMRAGPASAIRETITVNLPRPRDRTDPRLLEIYRKIQNILADEVAKMEVE